MKNNPEKAKVFLKKHPKLRKKLAARRANGGTTDGGQSPDGGNTVDAPDDLGAQLEDALK